jgi:Ser-tRNA(Ala) deacylase AlaX
MFNYSHDDFNTCIEDLNFSRYIKIPNITNQKIERDMEEKKEEIKETKVINFSERMISRKEAIKRTGYMAASAATMMVLLSNQSQANGRGGATTSPVTGNHGNNGNHGNGNNGDNGNHGGGNNGHHGND